MYLACTSALLVPTGGPETFKSNVRSVRLMTVMSTGTICDNHDLRKRRWKALKARERSCYSITQANS